MKKQNIMKIIASALAICVAVGTMPTAAWAAENPLSEGSGSVGASNPGGSQSSGMTSKSGAASAGAVSSDGFSDEGYTDGGEITELTINGTITEKTKYTTGEGHIYYAPAEEGGSAFLRLENVPETDGVGFYISGNSEISLTVEAAGSNSVGIYMEKASITLAGSGDLNNSTITAGKIEKDGFTGKLNAIIGIVSLEAGMRCDFTVYGECDYKGGFLVGSFGEAIQTLTIPRGASFTLPEGGELILSGDNGDYSKYLNIEGDFINNGNVICLGAEPDDPSAFVEELGFSGTGSVTVSSASDPSEIDNTKHVDYDNNGFRDMGVVDKRVDIDADTPKSFYRTDTRNRGKLYYTPPTAGSPALLKACNINYETFVISCLSEDIPVTLCMEGEYNCFAVEGNTDVTLDGTGGFAGAIKTYGEFSIAESFKGELNACIVQQTMEQSDNAFFAKADTVVYGKYTQMEAEDRLAFYESMTGEGVTAQAQATLRIPEGSTYIINEDCTANITNVGNDYEKYLKIDGKLINNGLIVCDGDVPDDPAAFIQSLNLSGYGVVVIRHTGSDGGIDTHIYSNDGIELEYENGDLDFEENTTDQVWGDHMDEYGYCFEEKNGSYVLTIKDFKTPDRVRLPSDKPVIINSSGVCVIGELSISADTDEVTLSFEGDGTLTVAKEIWIQDQGTVSIAEKAKIIAKNGLSGEEVRLAVSGSLTAMCDETGRHANAVYVNVLDIAGTGFLEVSGSRGVWIDRLPSDAGYSLSIAEGGQLVADCGEHGLVVCQRRGGESGPGAIIGIPEEYLPHGYEYIQASEENEYTPAVSLVLARKGSQITVSAEGRFITEGKGAEGYLVIHRHSEDYDTYIPDPDDPGQHIKYCSNGHTHFDSAEKHTGGKADCSRQAVCTICNQPYGDKDSSQHGDTEVRGTVEASCTEGGYTGDTYCKDCGEKLGSGKKTPALGHDWLLTHEEPATITSKGKKIYTCSRCGQTRDESIPKLPSTPTGTSTSTEATAEPTKQAKESVTPEEMRKNSEKLDSGISIKWKGNALALKWQKAAGAGGYDIFAAQSGKKMNKKSLVKTVKNGKTSVSLAKIAGKKISGEKAYSVKIKAWKYVGSKKIYTGESKTYHIVGKENKKYTNVKKLKPAKKKYVLKKGRNIRIKVTVVKQSKKKKLLPKSYGSALRYESGNKKIATVTQKGRVKAKKKGVCYITVVALNGVRTRIKITVK